MKVISCVYAYSNVPDGAKPIEGASIPNNTHTRDDAPPTSHAAHRLSTTHKRTHMHSRATSQALTLERTGIGRRIYSLLDPNSTTVLVHYLNEHLAQEDVR